jgi:hypothetical protein
MEEQLDHSFSLFQQTVLEHLISWHFGCKKQKPVLVNLLKKKVIYRDDRCSQNWQGGLGQWAETESPAEVNTLHIVKSRCYHLGHLQIFFKPLIENLEIPERGLVLSTDYITCPQLCQDLEKEVSGPFT